MEKTRSKSFFSSEIDSDINDNLKERVLLIYFRI